jgi:Protein of unknown function (DUF3995)
VVAALGREAGMTRAPHHLIPAAPATRPRTWAGYAAAAWALAFAGPHFYWGVGGVAGLDTALNREIVEGRGGWFLALNWAIGLFCIAGGVVALATVRPWGRRAPAWLLRGLAWLGFVLLAARAFDVYLEFGLGLTGIASIPPANGTSSCAWPAGSCSCGCPGSPLARSSGALSPLAGPTAPSPATPSGLRVRFLGATMIRQPGDRDRRDGRVIGGVVRGT